MPMQEAGPDTLTVGYSAVDGRGRCAPTRRLVEGALTFAACVGFMGIGPALIVTNKWLMLHGVPYPLLLTSMGQLTSIIFVSILIRCCGLCAPLPKVSWRFWSRNCLTVGLAQACAFGFGNSAYLFITVVLAEIVKGSAPVVVLLVQAAAGMGCPRPSMVGAVLMASAGVVLASFGDAGNSLQERRHSQLLGGGLMLLGTVCEAVRALLAQRLLKEMDFHPVVALYYLMPATLVLLLPPAIFADLRRLDVRVVAEALPRVWPALVASNFLATGITLCSYVVLQRTNAVVLKLLTIMRNAIVVAAGIVVLGNHVTALELAGISLTIVSTIAYHSLGMLSVQPDHEPDTPGAALGSTTARWRKPLSKASAPAAQQAEVEAAPLVRPGE